jgi:hypothetical protein
MFGTVNGVLFIPYTNKLQHAFAFTGTKQMEVETDSMASSVSARSCHIICTLYVIVCNAAKC